MGFLDDFRKGVKNAQRDLEQAKAQREDPQVRAERAKSKEERKAKRRAEREANKAEASERRRKAKAEYRRLRAEQKAARRDALLEEGVDRFDDDLPTPRISREERSRHKERILPRQQELVAVRKEQGLLTPHLLLKTDGETRQVGLVGESHYQGQIDLITGRIGKEGFTLHYNGKLSPFSENPKDPEALGVDVQGLRIGHLPSELSQELRPLVEEALRLNRSIGGHVAISAAPPHVAQTPNAGAVIDLPTEEAIRTGLEALLEEERAKQGWS